jgi:hypothetical protein
MTSRFLLEQAYRISLQIGEPGKTTSAPPNAVASANKLDIAYMHIEHGLVERLTASLADPRAMLR